MHARSDSHSYPSAADGLLHPTQRRGLLDQPGPGGRVGGVRDLSLHTVMKDGLGVVDQRGVRLEALDRAPKPSHVMRPRDHDHVVQGWPPKVVDEVPLDNLGELEHGSITDLRGRGGSDAVLRPRVFLDT